MNDLDDRVRALLEGEQRLRIAMPDHPIRRNKWFQMFVRLPRPALEWVTVASVGYAGIVGPAIQRPLGDGYLVQGDVNGDGLAELVVGNPDPTSAFVDNGPFVMMGRSDLTAVNVASFPSAAGYELAGDLRQFARMTAVPAVTADMVGDGRQDIISIGETGSPATGVAAEVRTAH